MDGIVPKPKSKSVDTSAADNLQDPVFTPPEELVDTPDPIVDTDTGPMLKVSPPKKTTWWRRKPTKKQLLIFIPIGLVLIGAIVAAVLMLTHKKPVPVVKKPVPVVQRVVEPPKPTTVAGKLTGKQITPELNQRGVTGVMIENSIDARPQSGLFDAGVVYEAIAEGGITRFLALYQEGQPDFIGPVRSSRPYYVNWLLPYSASYMHIGGSAVALQMISQLGIRDISEGGSDNPIQRITSRYAPHNAYTSMAKLDKVRANRGWGNPDFTGLARKADSPSKTPTATTIDFAISSSSFYVHYDYDAAADAYKRSEGGSPHLDEKSGYQLEPKVVVALIIPYSINADDIHSDYAAIGSGHAYIFQDGTMQDVLWSKPQDSKPLVLQDPAGNPIAINAGQTWFTALGTGSLATFKAPAATGP